MSRGLLLRLILILALLGGGVIVGLYFLRPVITVAPVRRATAVSAVPGTVTVRAERTYPVVADVPGRIVENTLKVGKTVAAGDLLVRIDGKGLEIEIAQIRSQIAAIEKRLELGSPRQFELATAREQLAYQEKLLGQNVIPAADVDAQRRVVQGLEQALALEKTELELQRATYGAALEAKSTLLEKTTLRSPIEGIVSRVDAFAGDLVGNGTLIAEVVSLTRIVDARISEENFENVKLGQSATVRLAGYGGGKFSGTVSKLPTTADPETQRYVVEITVAAAPEKLVPGMTGEAVITVSERANALLVPRPALVWDHVYVVANGRVSQRAVKVGFTALNEAEILEGVAEGEMVAIDGLDFLHDGTRVRVSSP